jgi:hypothetical protein
MFFIDVTCFHGKIEGSQDSSISSQFLLQSVKFRDVIKFF